MKFPNRLKGEARADLGRKWGIRSAAAWKPQSPDWNTICKRSKWDRKGATIRAGCAYHGDGRIVPWLLRHSLLGSVDQVDLLVGGRLYLTGSRRDAEPAIRWGRWLPLPLPGPVCRSELPVNL